MKHQIVNATLQSGQIAQPIRKTIVDVLRWNGKFKTIRINYPSLMNGPPQRFKGAQKLKGMLEI
ncbi:hypothetical protein BN8_02304 [Fibrisoma limi BUZ 3]|uniref:Uncharacterized protein n=1 Tax=Fibrisoma limi BUZ 3 TaxID=1185876 RepID=I2GH51_9BACT|nr:hypothetical protein [Fibrisoma limi]CCH53226.1 hypothetical protein BN8_02304 [Fibrisoma limi BUZ 3]